MYLDEVTRIIRTLAKSNYYQCLYNAAKDLGNIVIFKNTDNFTSLQLLFLHYLAFYNNLYTEIAMGEVDELVLKSFIFEDSYVMYKNKKNKDSSLKLPRAKHSNTSSNEPTYIFTTRKKE